MSVNSGSTIVVLVALLLIVVGVIWLQVFLSKKENKWPGLIIPLICIVISLSAVFGLVFFGPMESKESTSTMIFAAISLFILYNIPTTILMAVYIECRNKKRKKINIS